MEWSGILLLWPERPRMMNDVLVGLTKTTLKYTRFQIRLITSSKWGMQEENNWDDGEEDLSVIWIKMVAHKSDSMRWFSCVVCRMKRGGPRGDLVNITRNWEWLRVSIVSNIDAYTWICTTRIIIYAPIPTVRNITVFYSQITGSNVQRNVYATP